jgi:hypothetical protein
MKFLLKHLTKHTHISSTFIPCHKYRSAVYTFSGPKTGNRTIIATFQELSEKKLITQVLTFQILNLQS